MTSEYLINELKNFIATPRQNIEFDLRIDQISFLALGDILNVYIMG